MVVAVIGMKNENLDVFDKRVGINRWCACGDFSTPTQGEGEKGEDERKGNGEADEKIPLSDFSKRGREKRRRVSIEFVTVTFDCG